MFKVCAGPFTGNMKAGRTQPFGSIKNARILARTPNVLKRHYQFPLE